MFKLYRELKANETFVIGADPSEGGDFCAAVAKSKAIFDSPFVFHEKIDSTQFGVELYKMGKFIYLKTGIYPTILVERNTGAATIAKLQDLNYPKLFRMPKLGESFAKDEDSKIGWHTNSSSRIKLIDDYGSYIMQDTAKIYDKDTISELMSFIRNPRTGKAEASSGKHDDLCMAEMIAWQGCLLVSDVGSRKLDSVMKGFPQQSVFDRYGIPNV